MSGQRQMIDREDLIIAQVDTAIGEGGGDFYHRTYAPGVAMAGCEGIHVVNFNNVHHRRDQVMREADVLVLNNICDPDFLPLIRDRKDQGKITVFELCDDLDDVPSESPVHAFYGNPDHRLLFKRLAATCDAIQFSSAELKKKYGHLNRFSRVFPNQILEVPPERRPARRSEIIIGWGGSSGHKDDLARIAGPLIRWLMSRNDVQLYMMCNDSIWELFRQLPGHRKKRFETGSLADYYRFLEAVEIGVAPLEDTDFNKSRSDVKFLEYAAHGVVPVMQSAGPYPSVVRHGETGFLFHGPDDLVEIMDALAGQLSLRVKVSIAARDYVVRERLHTKHGKERTDFYRSLLPPCRTHGPENNGVSRTFEAFAAIMGAERKGRHLLLHSTHFEHLLWGGVMATDRPDHAKAAQMFSKASELEPHNYLPHLFGAYASEDTLGSLKRAAARNPSSIKAWMLMGEEFARAGDVPNALESFNAAAGIFPDYELPYLRSAAVLEGHGFEQERISLIRKARDLLHHAISKEDNRA